MSYFDELNEEVNAGLAGRNDGILLGFPRLNKYIGLRKANFFLIGGNTGSGKCLAKGTKVLMYNGTYKKVEDIKVDDLLMSTDSESTKVIGTCSGIEEMFSIAQKRGMTYIVNKSHILSLKPSGKQLMRKFGETLSIDIKSYLGLPKWQRDRLYGYKLGVDFPEKQLSLDPYILGVWLGDGTCAEPAISTPDPELKEAIYNFAKSINNHVRIDNSSSCPSYYIVAGRNQSVIKLDDNFNFIEEFKNACVAAISVNRASSNISLSAIKGSKCGGYFWKKNENNGTPFKVILRSLNILSNKHIPFEFSRNSKRNRLELLAGLVDTDGYYSNEAGYEIIQKNEKLANDIVWLSRSLGFYSSITPKLATMKRSDGTIYSCPVFRIQIYGEVHKIPCRVKRKQAKINTPNKDNTRGQLSIKSLGEGEYYGFELEGSKLFFLEDFTVTHNTSFVDNCFVLNPFEFIKSKENKTNIKLKIIYRSMERNKKYKLAKWMSGKIFMDHGLIIPISKLLGWKERMTKDEHDLYLSYQDYINEIEEMITIIDYPENPVGIAKELRAYALENGREEEIDQYNKIYIPNNNNEIVVIIADHIGLLKTTKDLPTKKEAIDKLSFEMRRARDYYGYTPVLVSQFNRSISNPMRLKIGDVEPNLEDFADSSQTQNDADVVLALFDPIRYKVSDISGYDLDKLKDNYGNKYFRSLRLIKNSAGSDDLRIGLAFLGELGLFKEMPKKSDITDSDYDAILNKTYFFKNS